MAPYDHGRREDNLEGDRRMPDATSKISLTQELPVDPPLDGADLVGCELRLLEVRGAANARHSGVPGSRRASDGTLLHGDSRDAPCMVDLAGLQLHLEDLTALHPGAGSDALPFLVQSDTHSVVDVGADDQTLLPSDLAVHHERRRTYRRSCEVPAAVPAWRDQRRVKRRVTFSDALVLSIDFGVLT